jgi:mRNA-degrading endonuclease RelE of RelBE toxin-antitoxin system
VSYQLELKQEAIADLRALPAKIQRQIPNKIDLLSANFKPPKSELIRGLDGIRRVRSGDYRIIYSEPDADDKIFVYSIKHRDVVYKALNR